MYIAYIYMYERSDEQTDECVYNLCERNDDPTMREEIQFDHYKYTILLPLQV